MHPGSFSGPEVTIPEQKQTKGKGTKMGSKEKRTLLLESEVSCRNSRGGFTRELPPPAPPGMCFFSLVLWQ